MRMILVPAAAAAVLAVAATGCSSGTGQSADPAAPADAASSDPASDGEPVAMEFWHGYTEADGDVLNELVADFNSSQSTIEITPVVKPWGTLLDTALPALTAGDGPQLLALPPENIPVFASRGALVPLDDWYETASGADELNPEAVATGQYEGQRYGAPLSFTPLTIFTNETLFDEAGVEVPTTWDEWVDAAAALTVDEDGDGTPEQFGLALQDNATVGNGVWISLLQSGGGDVVTPEGEVVIDSPENVETLQFWSQAVQDQSISPTGLTGVDADELFSSGRAAMTFAGPWMATIADESGIDYGIHALPEGPAGISASALAVDMAVTAQATETEQAAAEEFLTWFYQEDNMVTWSLASGWPPLTSTVDDQDVAENPVVAALTEQSQYGVALLPGVVPQAEVLTELDTATQKAMAGGSPEELLGEAQSAIEETMSQQ